MKYHLQLGLVIALATLATSSFAQSVDLHPKLIQLAP